MLEKNMDEDMGTAHRKVGTARIKNMINGCRGGEAKPGLWSQ